MFSNSYFAIAGFFALMFCFSWLISWRYIGSLPWEEINKDYLLDQASRAQNDSGKLQALSRRKKDSKALSTADSAAEATRTVQ